MTRRPLLIVSGFVGVALALGVLLAQPRTAWEVARAVADKQQQDGRAIDYSALTDRLEAYLNSDPPRKHARNALRAYFSLRERAGATERDLHALASHPSRQISDMAQAKLRRLALMREPLQLRFVALDGRQIDLQDLHGRVVLLDFWATWCSTCMRELPHLKSLYDNYHDQGFEIVAITLDDARDRQNVLALLKKENLLWPQYFPGDGHYVTSEVSKRFGVIGIPTTFLLDRQGMIAAMNVPGEELETAVRRLLALQTTVDGEARPAVRAEAST